MTPMTSCPSGTNRAMRSALPQPFCSVTTAVADPISGGRLFAAASVCCALTKTTTRSAIPAEDASLVAETDAPNIPSGASTSRP